MFGKMKNRDDFQKIKTTYKNEWQQKRTEFTAKPENFKKWKRTSCLVPSFNDKNIDCYLEKISQNYV